VTVDLSRVSIGLPGATPRDVLEALAPRIEAAGFRGLWLNDTPGGDSLAGLAAAARATSTLALGTGVIPLDRRAPADILGALSDVPVDRLSLGVGTGAAKHGLALVEHSVPELRAGTAASIVVGALGPRMRALAARVGDGVLLSWLTPAAAAAAMADLRRDAEGRPVRGVLYARTALTDDALPALRAEAARYGGYPAYAANLERIGATAFETTISDIARIDVYLDVVDEIVLRVITREPTLAEYERFIELAAAQ
jgi:alkanesulfonate monooxygenase SsuD/methylene tetrahydromethanopterin reductase-like flavin-dependent oxidoreductase (luciferase family)